MAEHFSNRDNFSQIHFSKGTLTIHNREYGCTEYYSGTYRTEASSLTFNTSDVGIRHCPGMPPKEVSGLRSQGTFEIRNNAVGEPEFVVKLKQGNSCSDGSHGKIILVRILMN